MEQNTIIITLGISVLTIITSIFLSLLASKHQIELWEMNIAEKYREKIIDRLLNAYEEIQSLTNELMGKFDSIVITYYRSKGMEREEIVNQRLRFTPPPETFSKDEKESMNQIINEGDIIHNMLVKKLDKYDYIIGADVNKAVVELELYVYSVLRGQNEYSISKSHKLRDKIRAAINNELKIEKLKSTFLKEE